MSKGNREIKKPKQIKEKPPAAGINAPLVKK